MAKRRSQRRLARGHRFTERGYKPYTSVIGQLVLAWNDLHERLGFLFIAILNHRAAEFDAKDVAPEHEGEFESHQIERISGIWSSSQFDRPKRAMLESLINHVIQYDLRAFPKFTNDLTWILSEANKLEDIRNNAVHTPLRWIGDSPIVRAFMSAHDVEVYPSVSLGNQRAVKLAKQNLRKDLVRQFRWARDASLVLRDFTILIHRALTAKVLHGLIDLLCQIGGRKKPTKVGTTHNTQNSVLTGLDHFGRDHYFGLFVAVRGFHSCWIARKNSRFKQM